MVVCDYWFYAGWVFGFTVGICLCLGLSFVVLITSFDSDFMSWFGNSVVISVSSFAFGWWVYCCVVLLGNGCCFGFCLLSFVAWGVCWCFCLLRLF